MVFGSPPGPPPLGLTGSRSRVSLRRVVAWILFLTGLGLVILGAVLLVLGRYASGISLLVIGSLLLVVGAHGARAKRVRLGRGGWSVYFYKQIKSIAKSMWIR